MHKPTFIIALLCFAFSVQAKDYLITNYGASTDSTILNTQAIQKIIDQASANGGGTIVIPQGTFLSGALFFKPNTRLKLLKDAVLKGSDNIADYPLIPSRMEGKKLDYYAALVNAYNVDNFSITGPGMINGNGLKFWKQFWSHCDSLLKIGVKTTNLEVHRPRLIFIWGCNNVKIQNVKLHNSGFWTTHLYQCKDILIEKCDIRSPAKPVPAPSTDGIDIDVCSNVKIRNCYVAVNDDAICIKGGKGPLAHTLPENGIVENIFIEKCTFGPSHASLTLGSESIHARNIVMRRCTVNNNCPLLKLKMRPDTYQMYENVTVKNIQGTCGSVINLAPWKQFYSLEGSSEKPYGIIRNIRMENIKVKCNKLGEMAGNPNDSVSNIVFKNISVTATKNDFKNNYKDVKFEKVFINGNVLK
ncbi:MAG: glycosyl hydrolase family 28 protein [Paludibacter sp.]